MPYLLVCSLLFTLFLTVQSNAELTHPRLMADSSDIARAKDWLTRYPWYRGIFEQHRKEIDSFLRRGPIFVSPIKQVYQYKFYTCPKHDVELMYEEDRPHDHRCPIDTTEVYSGGKYDAAWAGWYNRKLASYLLWMGLLYQVEGNDTYARAGREILIKFADLYLRYPTQNTILGPAHVFFGTLSESFWGVDMAYGYDLLYDYPGFSGHDREVIRDSLFYPLAHITQLFPESASNRQLWYNNVSAAVGFLYGDRSLIDFAMKGTYGFEWQLGSALPESGFWPEWSGYHYVALRGMIHLAEMARHNGMDLYHRKIAGRTMKDMFDEPFKLIKPNYEFPRNKDSGGGNILEYATFYEVGYAVYRDSLYLSLLNRTNITRGTQVVGEESGAREEQAPITMFNLAPELPPCSRELYQEESANLVGNGFAALKNGNGPSRRYLYLDYGIMGGEHGHPDRLQMGYYAMGRNWIVDPLNESYFNPNLQLWYRQTIAHNSIVIDQTSQTWTNGHGNFFGALPSLQIASGGSSTIYPGASVTRTLIQVGEYFIDLVDVDAAEHRVIDLPLHSFGVLSISGVQLKPQPATLFGPQPGIPGYDQLFDIRSGKTDRGWSGVFTEKDGAALRVDELGEPGSEVFQAMTPSIGGAYKQMVQNPHPLPMLMTRRKTARTRFARLLQAYQGAPVVKHFARGFRPLTYRISGDAYNDMIYCNVPESRYWLLRSVGGKPVLLAGFNIDRVSTGRSNLVRSLLPLDRFECRWQGDSVLFSTGPWFGSLHIVARGARHVLWNGSSVPFRAHGDTVVVEQEHGGMMSVATPHDSLLFIGYDDTLTVSYWGTSGVSDAVATVQLDANWRERTISQLSWWGGIVNLKATNKKPIERTLTPVNYSMDMGWLEGRKSSSVSSGARSLVTLAVPLRVPNDTPPVVYDVSVKCSGLTAEKRLTVEAPVSATLFMPNGKQAQCIARLHNNRSRTTSVAGRFIVDSRWSAEGQDTFAVRLAPLESRDVALPVRLLGYSSDNQRYPVRLRLHSGGFHKEIVHDMYIGVAWRAASPPSLDGSWRGWDRTHPMTIDTASQVCRLLLGNQPWNGKADLSASVSVMYDDAFLYVGADVRDDSVVTHWNFPVMSYPWDTDCMEVVLDTRTNSAQGHDPPTPGLYRHLSLAEHRLTEFSATLWQGGGAGGPTLPKTLLVQGAETFFHRTSSGYIMMCRYPISSLAGFVPRPGTKVGFDVAISDNDGTTYRKNQHIWSGFTQNQSWWDMGTVGGILLGPVREEKKAGR